MRGRCIDATALQVLRRLWWFKKPRFRFQSWCIISTNVVLYKLSSSSIQDCMCVWLPEEANSPKLTKVRCIVGGFIRRFGQSLLLFRPAGKKLRGASRGRWRRKQEVGWGWTNERISLFKKRRPTYCTPASIIHRSRKCTLEVGAGALLFSVSAQFLQKA